MSGLSDEDQPQTFVRKHKQLVRRASSFTKYTNICETVNTWFFTDVTLHAAFAKFARENCLKSSAFQPRKASSTSSAANNQGGGMDGDVVLDVQSKAIHEDFCNLFESLLENFLDRKNVTMVQFQETFRLDDFEEKKKGSHFYRWMEAIEFTVFLVWFRKVLLKCNGNPSATQASTLLSQLYGIDDPTIVQPLLQEINKLSAEAKLEFRKRSEISPLILKWMPESFEEIDSALQLAIQSSQIPPQQNVASVNINGIPIVCRVQNPISHSKQTRIELARWKTKLTTKVLNPATNVYQAPAPDEDQWARYLAFFVQEMKDEDFSSVIQFLDAYAQAKEEKREEGKNNSDVCDDAEKSKQRLQDRQRRRLAYEFFIELDGLHTGKVDLYVLCDYLDEVHGFASITTTEEVEESFHSCPAAASRCKKLLLKWAARVGDKKGSISPKQQQEIATLCHVEEEDDDKKKKGKGGGSLGPTGVASSAPPQGSPQLRNSKISQISHEPIFLTAPEFLKVLLDTFGGEEGKKHRLFCQSVKEMLEIAIDDFGE